MSTPQASFAEACLHEDLAHMVAAYAFHIEQNQPFLDGKKLYDATATTSERRMDEDGLAVCGNWRFGK